MKKYIKPAIELIKIENEAYLMAGSPMKPNKLDEALNEVTLPGYSEESKDLDADDDDLVDDM